MTRGGRRAAVALTMLALVPVAGGCGVQLDDEPRPLAADDVPYGLLEPTTSAPSAGAGGTAPTAPDGQGLRVFLIDTDGYLVGVTRPAVDEPDVARAVTTLLGPVTDAEREAGLTTAIAPSTGLRGVIGPEDGLVTIDLTSRIDDGSPDVVRAALAQLVYTATAVPGVRTVLFQVDGEAREVPTGQGRSTAEPLSSLDYRQLLPPPTSTTVAGDARPPG